MFVKKYNCDKSAYLNLNKVSLIKKEKVGNTFHIVFKYDLNKYFRWEYDSSKNCDHDLKRIITLYNLEFANKYDLPALADVEINQ